MPNSPYLWVAAGILWIMDASINVSMEPFRAFVGDMLPEKQRTSGFAMQTFFIGIGAVVASALPWMMANWFDVSNTAAPGVVPDSVKWSFYLGGAAFLLLYGLLSFYNAIRLDHGLLPSEIKSSSAWQSALTCLAFTWLNPHVYLDTVVLLGSVSTQFGADITWFAGGAVLASFAPEELRAGFAAQERDLARRRIEAEQTLQDELEAVGQEKAKLYCGRCNAPRRTPPSRRTSTSSTRRRSTAARPAATPPTPRCTSAGCAW